MNEQEWHQRVRDEYEELLVKLDKLNLFIRGIFFVKLTELEQNLLIEQQETMNQYANTLRKRICLFSLF